VANSTLIRVVHLSAEWCQTRGAWEGAWVAHGSGELHPFLTSELVHPPVVSVLRLDLLGSLTTIGARNIRFVLDLGPKICPRTIRSDIEAHPGFAGVLHTLHPAPEIPRHSTSVGESDRYTIARLGLRFVFGNSIAQVLRKGTFWKSNIPKPEKRKGNG
jgi:hypothetical protein